MTETYQDFAYRILVTSAKNVVLCSLASYDYTILTTACLNHNKYNITTSTRVGKKLVGHLMAATEAPAQGVEMSYQTNSSGAPPSSIGLWVIETPMKKKGLKLGKSVGR